MKKSTLIFLSLFACIGTFAQGPVLKTGDHFPEMLISNIINAPVKSFDISQSAGSKFFILNFWGTWCSPCIPEMDALAKLQVANADKIQVIAISNDSPERLKKYLAKKLSKLWLASDTAFFLYQAIGFSYVGQSAIINNKHQIIALVRTDSIDQKMINDLVNGKPIKSNAEINEQAVKTGADIFGVDSTMAEDFTIRSYIKGQQSMSRRYINPPYLGRRISFINLCITNLYKTAFDITSENQVVYEVDKKDVCDFDNKSSLYCFDLLVKDKDSLLSIMQKKLNAVLPIKARMGEKLMPVYLLKLRTDTTFNLPVSAQDKLSYGFSGTGFDGTGVTLADFAANYLSNEFELPVVDATGLDKRYDIKTNVDMRTKAGILKSISDLGLTVEKSERMMKVLIFYK